MGFVVRCVLGYYCLFTSLFECVSYACALMFLCVVGFWGCFRVCVNAPLVVFVVLIVR